MLLKNQWLCIGLSDFIRILIEAFMKSFLLLKAMFLKIH